MSGLLAFFEMGGYGVFVWPSYGLTAFVLVALLVASARARRDSERTLARLRDAEPAKGRRHAS